MEGVELSRAERRKIGRREHAVKMSAVREQVKTDLRNVMYFHVHEDANGAQSVTWRGFRFVKMPTDLVLYAEMIFKNKPDWIIETGTAYGGSAMFFGDMLTLIGAPGKCITIDIAPRATPPHPKVEYVIGSSIDAEIVEKVKGMVAGTVHYQPKVMVVLDASHKTRHVLQELRIYQHILTSGQYMVVEDCYANNGDNPMRNGPLPAVDYFLRRTVGRFVRDNVTDKYIFGITRDGWLRKVS
jgi:cephalosporin hydroxylase